MSLRPADLDEAALAFLSEYHLASLTTLRADGSPHVVPVGFSYDQDERVVGQVRERVGDRAPHTGDAGVRPAHVSRAPGAPTRSGRRSRRRSAGSRAPPRPR